MKVVYRVDAVKSVTVTVHEIALVWLVTQRSVDNVGAASLPHTN